MLKIIIDQNISKNYSSLLKIKELQNNTSATKNRTNKLYQFQRTTNFTTRITKTLNQYEYFYHYYQILPQHICHQI